jgi:hypothetical protein
MWSFESRRSLSRALGICVVGLAGAAAAFYQFQNAAKPVGGDISLVKLIWLASAIFLWFVLPLLLAFDAQCEKQLRKGFALLALLMLARGVVEGWMLYVWLNWSPWYGIAHDVVCAVVLLSVWAQAAPRTPLGRLVRTHALVSAAFFLPEIYFAWYMLTHFTTQGAGAIYFVPDDPRYAVVLRATLATVVCLSLYLPAFLYRWIRTPQTESP